MSCVLRLHRYRVCPILLFLTFFCFFFFNAPATTEIYTLSLHDALPISAGQPHLAGAQVRRRQERRELEEAGRRDVQLLDRKSTRLNSSHANISYAVFCLKKKNRIEDNTRTNESIGARAVYIEHHTVTHK